MRLFPFYTMVGKFRFSLESPTAHELILAVNPRKYKSPPRWQSILPTGDRNTSKLWPECGSTSGEFRSKNLFNFHWEPTCHARKNSGLNMTRAGFISKACSGVELKVGSSKDHPAISSSDNSKPFTRCTGEPYPSDMHCLIHSSQPTLFSLRPAYLKATFQPNPWQDASQAKKGRTAAAASIFWDFWA